MKKTILSIAVIAAAFVATSCQKENLQENTASEGSASVFTATIETVAGTKTTVERIDGSPATYKTYWESTDKISINGVIYTATPDGTDATKATFAKDPDTQTDPTGTFMAYFPKELFTQIKGLVNISLPPTYHYVEGKYNMPMYAESTTTSLSFKNLCGVLAITVKGEDFTSVEKIEVFSDKQMNGEFTAAADGTLTFKAEGVTLTDANRKVTLEFTSAKTIASDGSATFYIPVPANTHNPLIIKVTGGSTPKVMVTKKSGGVAVVRNTVYPIAFDGQPIKGTAKRTGDINVNWVQLWAGGPKFAEYNVGVTDGKAESYGGYYCWGKAIDKDSSGSYKGGESALSGDDDTATNLWGGNWRMPTQTDLQKLLSNCTVEWTQVNSMNGRKFTGKGAYASNSVFLPAAGYCSCGWAGNQGNAGDYWSSTPSGGDGACFLYFASGDQGVGSFNRSSGYSVRAVLAE